MKWNKLFSSYNVFNHTLQYHTALMLLYQVPSLSTSSSNDYQKDTNICLNLYARESFKIESLHPKGAFKGDGRGLGGLIQSNIRSVRIHVGVVHGLLGLNLKLQPTPDAGYERNRKGNQTALDHLQNVCVSVCDVYCACWSIPFLGILEDHLKA